jgi:hypothetical protein
MKRLLVALLFIVFSGGKAFAGGSVMFQDIDKILRQKAPLAEYLHSSLEFEGAPLAEVRFGPQFTHLSAGRMGPYTLYAKLKGKSGKATLEVTICTTPTFLDTKGNKAADMFTAASVTEQFTGIIIQDAAEAKHHVSCPSEY